MNVVLIPFFLAANVAVNDVSEWTFGPEYSYHLNMTYSTKTETLKHVTVGYMTTTIKCRPKESDVLLCYFGTITNWQNGTIAGSYILEKSFGIKFNEHGIENLMIELIEPYNPYNIYLISFVRVIANQFSMDVNEMRNNEVQSQSDYSKREDTIMRVNCMTNYVIEHKETEGNQIEENASFQLEVLPVPGIVKPEMTLAISKIRRDCINATELTNNTFRDGIFNLDTFNTVVLINNEFKIFTLINGTLISPPKDPNWLIQIGVELNLESIKPADHELPSTFHGEVIEVNTGIPRNSTN